MVFSGGAKRVWGVSISWLVAAFRMAVSWPPAALRCAIMKRAMSLPVADSAPAGADGVTSKSRGLPEPSA
ncbi:hypothetical protein D3C73_1622030 [compost metagenome]